MKRKTFFGPLIVAMFWLAPGIQAALAQMPAMPPGVSQALAACAGQTGDALKQCVARNSGGAAANCDALPSPQRERCAAMKDASDGARATCQSKFDPSDHGPFEACMKAEMARLRVQTGH